jgi:hypothetical protein
MRLIGLYREAEYSPGRHRSNDAELLDRVAHALKARGFRVDLLTIGEAAAERNRAAIVFSMCQGRTALDTLAVWEHEGVRVMNSPKASLNTYRDRLPAVMRSAGVPFPKTTLVGTAGAAGSAIDVNRGVWLKRGDVHATISADVQWVDSLDRLHEGLREFASRGIAHAALQPHHPGDEIKFYGVASSFFHWYYSDEGPSSAGHNDKNGSVKRRHALDVAALHLVAQDAATAAGLDIFGGDVIVGASGALTVIDLNDWPSFAPCRDRASEAIADHLMRRVDAAWNPGLVSSADKSAI